MTAVLEADPAVDLGLGLDKDRCYYDLLYFYRECLLHGNRTYQHALGRIHNFMCDFLRLDELQHMSDQHVHSPIRDYLPAKDKQHCWPERWIYWPTLDAVPMVEDGPDCSIANDFRDGSLLTEQRGGLIVRAVGDGDTLYQLVPRGHLKTSLGTFACSLQDIIRDETTRILIRSGEEELPAKVLALMKYTFESNQLFKEHWGKLVPDRHASLWNRAQMQVASDTRRGADPTLSAFGMGTNITGAHGDKVVFDDVVTLQNIALQEKIKDKVSEVAFVVDRGFRILGQGTLYEDGDAHSIFIRPTGGGYPFTSLLIASLLDARGQPLWEYYTPRLIEKKKGLCIREGRGLTFWYSQMWNNPFIAKEEGFREEWLDEYDCTAEEALAKYPMSVVVATDPGTGKSDSAGWATAMVKGQDDTGRRYVLDGFRERLSPDELPVAIVGLCAYWDEQCRKAGRGGIRLGIEENNTKTWLFPAIKNEMRRRGLSWSIEPLKHGNKPKPERVRILGPVYASHSVLWPAGDMPRYTGQWFGARDEPGQLYDFKKAHRNEYRKFPAIHAEILDSEAYTEQMMRPDQMKTDPAERQAPRPEPGAYRRPPPVQERSPGRYLPPGLEAANRKVIRSGGQMGRAMAGDDDEW